MQTDFPAFPLVYRSKEKGLNHQVVIRQVFPKVLIKICVVFVN